MKLSKTLLKAIAIGVTIGSTTACVGTLQDIENTSHEESQAETEGKCEEGIAHNWEDCPACGMG